MLSAERCENEELRRDELVCTMHPPKALNSLQDKKSATGAPGVDLNYIILHHKKNKIHRTESGVSSYITAGML